VDLFNQVRKYIDKIAAFRLGARASVVIEETQIKGRGLLLAIPPGATAEQREAFNPLRSYGTSVGVTVDIIEIE
jgi:hypothetical protein